MIIEQEKKVEMDVSLKMKFGLELGPRMWVEVGNGRFGWGLQVGVEMGLRMKGEASLGLG